MGKHRLVALLTIAVVLVPAAVLAQESPLVEAGLPFFSEHYAPDEYDGFPQNQWICQDHRGIIYVANSRGILEFDGETWRTIETPLSPASLTVDKDGTIYVGLLGDLGYLKPGPRGSLHYASLAEHLPDKSEEVGDIWTLHSTPEGVYFQSRKRILRWDGAKFNTWHASSGAFHVGFAVEGRYIVREHGIGLLEIKGDRLVPIPDGARFASEQVYGVMMLGSRLLVAGRQNGLFLEGEEGFARYETEADAYLLKHKMTHGVMLPNRRLAFSTAYGGVVILDEQGHLLDLLTIERGLPDQAVNRLFVDAQGGLWLALNNQGVMRVDVASPLSVFDEQIGLHGIVYHLNRSDDELYVATGAGFYRLDLASRRASRVRGLDTDDHGLYNVVWSSAQYGDALLVGTNRGLLQVDQAGNFDRVTRQPTYSVLVSKADPSVVFLGTSEGLKRIRRSGSSWIRDDRLPLVGEDVRDVVEESGGAVWFGTSRFNLYRLKPSSQGPVELKRYTSDDGLPSGPFGMEQIGGSVAMIRSDGVYRFEGDGSKPAFVRDEQLRSPWAEDSDVLLTATEDNQGNVWLVYSERTDIARPEDGYYSFTSPDVLRLGDQGASFVDVYVEDEGTAWLTYADKLVRYDPSEGRSYETFFSAQVRRVNPIGKDWTIFSGSHASDQGGLTNEQPESQMPELVYSLNDLRFEVAAPSYNDTERNLYQYYLEGRDEGWSDWTSSSSVAYTNLSEGDYRLRVRAKNAQGYLSAETGYVFSIMEPWYRTWWAYLAYASMLVGVTVLLLHYQRMRRENAIAQEQARELALERVVNERLTQVNDRLRQADLLKDQLLSTTSHELRTPITAILGFTSVLKNEAPSALQEFLDIIEENGHRLMRTVTSMVDFARLQAGVIEVDRQPVEVSREVEQVVSRLTHQARKKQLDLDFIQPKDSVHAWLDRKCLERIAENLLSNAIKFTEEGGVTVRVGADDDYVFVEVQDSGIGMDPDFLPDLFKAFKQESTGLARTHEGTGLGLAITGRLVELMDGEIDVQTSKGEGTNVKVSFPVFYVSPQEKRSTAGAVRRRSSA